MGTTSDNTLDMMAHWAMRPIVGADMVGTSTDSTTYMMFHADGTTTVYTPKEWAIEEIKFQPFFA